MAKRPRPMVTRKLTVDAAVDEAFSEIEGLAEEMREAFDNTPESLQSGGVGEARGEAADNLENISRPDVPAALAGEDFAFEFSTIATKGSQSRAARRDDATALMDAIIQYLDERKEGLEEEADEADNDESEAGKKRQELIDDIDSLRDELDSAKDEADQVYFPGMYG